MVVSCVPAANTCSSMMKRKCANIRWVVKSDTCVQSKSVVIFVASDKLESMYDMHSTLR